MLPQHRVFPFCGALASPVGSCQNQAYTLTKIYPRLTSAIEQYLVSHGITVITGKKYDVAPRPIDRCVLVPVENHSRQLMVSGYVPIPQRISVRFFSAANAFFCSHCVTYAESALFFAMPIHSS